MFYTYVEMVFFLLISLVTIKLASKYLLLFSLNLNCKLRCMMRRDYIYSAMCDLKVLLFCTH